MWLLNNGTKFPKLELKVSKILRVLLILDLRRDDLQFHKQFRCVSHRCLSHTRVDLVIPFAECLHFCINSVNTKPSGHRTVIASLNRAFTEHRINYLFLFIFAFHKIRITATKSEVATP